MVIRTPDSTHYMNQLTHLDATNVVDLSAENQGHQHVDQRVENPENVGSVNLHSMNTMSTQTDRLNRVKI
jgi:hypothetical protein